MDAEARGVEGLACRGPSAAAVSSSSALPERKRRDDAQPHEQKKRRKKRTGGFVAVPLALPLGQLYRLWLSPVYTFLHALFKF